MPTIEFYRHTLDDNPLSMNTIPDEILLPRNTYTPDLQSASSLTKEIKHQKDHIVLTHTVLDRILPNGIEEGILTLLHAPESSRFYLPLYIELVLRFYNKRPIYFIDCNNLFPVYEIIESAVARRIPDPHEPLNKVMISRCFNYHQMTELIDQHLEPAIVELVEWERVDPPPLIIVAGISSLHFSQEAADYLRYDKKPPWWCVFELQQSLGILKNLSMKYRLPILLTTSSLSQQSLKALGGTFLMHTAQAVIKIEETGAGVYGTLIKHPSYPSQRVLIQQPMTTGGESYQPLENFFSKKKVKKNMEFRSRNKIRFPQKKRKKIVKLARISTHKQSNLQTYFTNSSES
ncbi:MAG: hypothetical protein ACW981_04430 [Candidatus Hodarchaeales archaeon]